MAGSNFRNGHAKCSLVSHLANQTSWLILCTDIITDHITRILFVPLINKAARQSLIKIFVTDQLSF